jgi:hypothetical protein
MSNTVRPSIQSRTVDYLHNEKESTLARRNELEEQSSAITVELSLLDDDLSEIELLLDLLDDSTPGIVVEDNGNKWLGVANRKRILDVIEQNPTPITPQAITAATGLRHTTVQDHLTKMMADGRVTRNPGQSNGGRAPYVYSLTKIVEYNEHHLDLKTRLVED